VEINSLFILLLRIPSSYSAWVVVVVVGVVNRMEMGKDKDGGNFLVALADWSWQMPPSYQLASTWNTFVFEEG